VQLFRKRGEALLVLGCIVYLPLPAMGEVFHSLTSLWSSKSVMRRILLPLGLRLALGQIYTNPFAEVLLVRLRSLACLLCLSHSSLVVPKRHVSSDFAVGS